jgi:hypothetical protein
VIARRVIHRGTRPAWPVAVAGLCAGTLSMLAVAGGDPLACAGVPDPAQRLACYDAIFRGASAAPTTPTTTASSDAGAPAAPREFGLNDSVRRARGEPDSRTGTPERIESTVVAVATLPGGLLRVTLENGQVWDQTEAASSFLPRPGRGITLRRGAIGSFLMRAESGPAVRARRSK